MMTAPSIVGSVGNDTCFYRIEMNVAQQSDHVTVGVDQLGFVAPLEQMAGSTQLPVSISRVTRGNTLHDLAQRPVDNLDQQMNVIGHPTERVNARAESPDDFGNNGVERLAISRSGEQRFAMIASQHHVIEAAWNMQSRKAGHPRTFANLEMTIARLEREMLQ